MRGPHPSNPSFRARHRGYTLVEVLASIAIASLLMIALLTVTRMVGNLRRSLDIEARWRFAAENLLRGIHDELASGWRPDAADPARGPRVRFGPDELVVHVRTDSRSSEVAWTVAYHVDDRDRLMRTLSDGHHSPRSTVALGDVTGFRVHGEEDQLVLYVQSSRGGHAERAFSVPPEITR
jgi:prepilin-type N-terminal cleavage/methylation domain-containing protein